MEELRIIIPEGQEIDWKESSKQEKIVFKSKTFKPRSWEEYCNKTKWVGYYIDNYSNIECAEVDECYLRAKEDKNLLPTKELAKSALAMARISQIMANDSRFGGAITDNEWNNKNLTKYTIFRYFNEIKTDWVCWSYSFLAFHTKEQCSLFLKENEDLVKDYLMID